MAKKLSSSFHDWEITGLDINRENKTLAVKLWFPDTDEKVHLLLEGVSRFSCSGAMLQNVILDFLVFEKHSESNYLKYCYKVLDIDSSVFCTHGSDENNKILFIEPSVGMELACCYQLLTQEIEEFR
ncbi:hypothetical protein [Kiloniella laminariae]|uniref:hypothetical protein n=1 Tax=Kiloniella laminariae TaxID=454162 RepID=UPI0003779B4E|nr:hypothetical protein [Kiloniella laminariae]